MSTSDDQAVREHAVAPTLVAVRSAAEVWAKGTTNGAAVWDVGAESIPDLWAYWRDFLRDHSWHARRSLIATLDDIAAGCGDARVSAAVESAKVALTIHTKDD